MLIVSSPGPSPNNLEPHSRQKPRRAPASLRGLLIQRRPRCSDSWRSLLSAAAVADTCPCHRRHSPQWQISTSWRGPATSYLTAPQRQPPVAMREGSSGERDHDVLDLGVVLERVHAEVFAVAGLFEAAVGHLGGEWDVVVDPYAPEPQRVG